MRRHAVSKLCAVWFIVLILTPFTAPFRSYELANQRSDQAHEWLAKDKVSTDEKLVGLSVVSFVSPDLNVVVLNLFNRPIQVDQHQPRFAVLRV